MAVLAGSGGRLFIIIVRIVRRWNCDRGDIRNAGRKGQGRIVNWGGGNLMQSVVRNVFVKYDIS